MDETYIKVAGKDRCLYRAVDKFGDTVDFLLTKRRMKRSAQKFFNKAIANNQNPMIINIDKSVSNFSAISRNSGHTDHPIPVYVDQSVWPGFPPLSTTVDKLMIQIE